MASKRGVSIGVLGLGNWGTALSDHLARNGHHVVCWDRDAAVIQSVRNHGKNSRYHSEFTLHEDLQPVDDPDTVFQQPVLLLTIPSKALEEVFKSREMPQDTMIISAIKGLEPHTLLTPLQFMHKRYPMHERLAVFSGPSFSSDVIRRRPAGVVAASRDGVVAREVSELFRGDTMRVYLSSDPLGVELGGILKNVIALAVGVSDGLDLGDSARAALITRGLAEMTRLAVAMGAQEKTLFGLSGMGDLIMTATCDRSRNRTVGLRLGRGEPLEDILRTLGSTAEAVGTTQLVMQLAEEHQVEMPIAEAASAMLAGEVSPSDMIQRFISRPTKSEF
ncbi:MAG: NAD(P)-dependent glycerol-3-phosphate dehydrogenase [Bdellovibrionales bacterium]|nr:NAD(P)-dependent glycerol-3-phosphate dehydrogenase [Bdellovibrionales bacterium]